MGESERAVQPDEGKADDCCSAESREGPGARAVSEPGRLLGELSEEERRQALERFALLRPCLV